MSSVSLILKNQTVVLLGNVLNRSLDFLIIIILARKLGVDGFGQYSFLYVYYSFWAIVVEMGFSTILVREYARSEETYSLLLGRALLVSSGLCIIAIPLSFLGLWITDYPVDTIKLALPASLLVLASARFLSLRKIFSSIFQARYVMHIPIGIEIVERLFLVTLLLSFSTISVLAAILLLVGTSLAALLMESGISLKMSGAPSFQRTTLSMTPIMRASIQTFFTGAAFLVMFKGNVLFISMMISDSAVGIFHAASRVPEALGLISAALTAPLFPLLSKKYVENREGFWSTYGKGIRMMAAISMFFACLLMPIITDLVPLLMGEVYRDAGDIAVWLVGAQVLLMVMTLFNSTLFASNQVVLCLIVTSISAGMNLLLNWIFIPIYGLWGSVAATIISYGMYIPLGVLVPALRPYSFAVARSLIRPSISITLAMVFVSLVPMPFLLSPIVSGFLFIIVFVFSGGIRKSDLLLVKEAWPGFNIDSPITRIVLIPREYLDKITTSE
jgi:O-antigen/teichoic acid export membrane protein